jgi:hypothetical protein
MRFINILMFSAVCQLISYDDTKCLIISFSTSSVSYVTTVDN